MSWDSLLPWQLWSSELDLIMQPRHVSKRTNEAATVFFFISLSTSIDLAGLLDWNLASVVSLAELAPLTILPNVRLVSKVYLFLIQQGRYLFFIYLALHSTQIAVELPKKVSLPTSPCMGHRLDKVHKHLNSKSHLKTWGYLSPPL